MCCSWRRPVARLRRCRGLCAKADLCHRWTPMNTDGEEEQNSDVRMRPQIDADERRLDSAGYGGAKGKDTSGAPLGAGLGLMVVPYFIPNVLLMAAASCAITVLPWILRES